MTQKPLLRPKIFINLMWIVLMILVGCKQSATKTTTLQRIEGKQIPINAQLSDEPSVERYIAPYREDLTKEMNALLSYAPMTLDNSREQDETLLGNFLADLCQKRAQEKLNDKTTRSIDFTLFNIGGLRASIEQGPVRVIDAFEVMPFENILVVAELDYQSVKELLNYLAHSANPHPISQSLRVVFNGDRVSKALVNGKTLNTQQTYLVLTNDYLLNGGDYMDFFKRAKQVYELDYKVREALIDELKALDTINVSKDQRMIRQ